MCHYWFEIVALTHVETNAAREESASCKSTFRERTERMVGSGRWQLRVV